MKQTGSASSNEHGLYHHLFHQNSSSGLSGRDYFSANFSF